MWQLLLIFYFIFATSSYLVRKVLAQKLGDYNLLINAIFFLAFLLPTTIVLSAFFPHNLNIGFLNLFLLLGGSVIWPIMNIVSFHANKKVDVGIFTIITNLSPIFTLAIAIPFLHESLNFIQFLGIVLLIFSGILAASSQLSKHKTTLEGVLVCLLTSFILGVAISYERFMLNRIDFGTYLIFGWGAQILWSTILAAREFKKLPTLLKESKDIKLIFVYGGIRTLQAVAFITALKISGSASIISAGTNFLSVTVLIGAYFILKERQHMLSKWLAAAIGITGLILLAK